MTTRQAANPTHSAELLRRALPLMTRLHIPPSPSNYAVWFEHVSGSNPELSAEIEARIEAEQPFTQDVNDGLYQRYVCECDLAHLEKIRNDMAVVLRDVEGSMSEAGRNVDHYSGQISGISTRVETSKSLDEIKDLLHVLIEETRTIQKATQALREHFDEKSAEIVALKDELQRERKRAVTDPLTGLPNRHALLDALEQVLSRGDAGESTALIMVDIDHFKSVNDRYGHVIGDRVLCYIADLLHKNIKGKDTAARFGGEEFAILLPETNLEGACALAESVRRSIAEAKLVRSDTKEPLGNITASLGIAVLRRGEGAMELIERADQAMYEAKSAGRNRVVAQPAGPVAAPPESAA